MSPSKPFTPRDALNIWRADHVQSWELKAAGRAETYIDAFLQDNSQRTAEELEEMADALSPGGAHDGGELVRLVQAYTWLADPLLVAATIRYNWHGGKVGFQFLPDPATTDPETYDEEAWSLMTLFDEATDGDPRRILTGADRGFFDSLPDRFTVYRGCASVPLENAKLGVCWTVRREVAEWFARRSALFNGGDPVLIASRIRKADVRIVKASEWEVVTVPRWAHALKCRLRKRSKWQPAMTWSPESAETGQQHV